MKIKFILALLSLINVIIISACTLNADSGTASSSTGSPGINGTAYYVRNGGSDYANGKSDATAWTTLAKVQSFSFVPGDRILLKCGSSWNNILTFPSSGSSKSGIVLSSYGTGRQPEIGQLTLSGKEYIAVSNICMIADSNNEALIVDHCNDLTIDGITADGQKLMNNNRYQLVSFSYSHNVTIRNSTIKNGGNHIGSEWGGGLGINRGCHDFLVLNNLVYNQAEHCMQCYSDDDQYPDYNITFRGNTIYNEEGYWDDCRGINVGWRSYNIIVERNNISNTKAMLIGIDSYTHDVIIRNNLLFYTIDSGNSRFVEILANLYGDNSNTSVYNNSMFHTSRVSGGAFISIDTYEGHISTGHLIYNNLFVTYNPAVAFIYDTTVNNLPRSEFKSDYNLFYSMTASGSFLYRDATYNNLNDWMSASGQDSNSIYGNPLLKGIDAYTNNFNEFSTTGSELFSYNWQCYFDTGSGASGICSNTTPAGLEVDCTASGSVQGNIQLYNTVGLNIESGKWYILSFKAKSSIPFSVFSTMLIKMGPPYTSYTTGIKGGSPLITTNWETYFTYFYTSQAASDGRITWYLGNSIPAGAAFNMDDISFKLADGLNNSAIFPDITDYATPGNSPCVDAGLTLSGVTGDYLDRPRPSGSGYDIGAYEYQK